MIKAQFEKYSIIWTVKGETLKDIIPTIASLQDLPNKCDCCGNPGLIRFEHRTPKGYEYFSLKCVACGARKNFGIKKEDGSLFMRWEDKFEKFDNGKAVNKPSTKTTTKITTEEDFLNTEPY